MNVFLCLCLTACLFAKGLYGYAENELIIVKKKNVEYKFVKFDESTDHFTRNVFCEWNNEAFDVFDRIKDKNTIAIDLGAGIGATSIWLSKNFHSVLALESKQKSLECLRRNLEASECTNVIICEIPCAEKCQTSALESVQEKTISDNQFPVAIDEKIRSITFKQLIHDYIYIDDNVQTKTISFINCNIDGKEEDILEDVLHFAYNNQCSVYINFDLQQWKNKNIVDFENLFSFFNTNCPAQNLTEYLTVHPTASILFQPNQDKGALVKRNIPVFVIGYNQLTFIRNMVKQLEKFTTDISIIDNGSSFQPLLDYYKNDYPYTILRQKGNYGHLVFLRDAIQRLSGDLYIVTDPDLQLNPNLPENFVNDFIEISKYFGVNKVGFALFIDSDDIRTDVTFVGHSIKSWERQFWVHRLHYPPSPDAEMYASQIDTTFCLINRKFPHGSIRVAGPYTCIHIPWHIGFQKMLEKGEAESYIRDNTSTSWFK